MDRTCRAALSFVPIPLPPGLSRPGSGSPRDSFLSWTPPESLAAGSSLSASPRAVSSPPTPATPHPFWASLSIYSQLLSFPCPTSPLSLGARHPPRPSFWFPPGPPGPDGFLPTHLASPALFNSSLVTPAKLRMPERNLVLCNTLIARAVTLAAS